MSNDGTSAYSATLKFTSGASTTTIGQITKVGYGPGKITDIDITTMSGVTKFKEYITGLIEPGDFNAECNFASANQALIEACVDVAGTWTVQFNDGTAPTSSSKWASAGYLNPVGFEGPMDNTPITSTLTIKLSGKPTFTAKT